MIVFDEAHLTLHLQCQIDSKSYHNLLRINVADSHFEAVRVRRYEGHITVCLNADCASDSQQIHQEKNIALRDDSCFQFSSQLEVWFDVFCRSILVSAFDVKAFAVDPGQHIDVKEEPRSQVHLNGCIHNTKVTGHNGLGNDGDLRHVFFESLINIEADNVVGLTA